MRDDRIFVVVAVNIMPNGATSLVKNPFFRQCLSDICLILYSAIGKKTAILAIALHRYQPVVASAGTANRTELSANHDPCLMFPFYYAAGNRARNNTRGPEKQPQSARFI